MKRLLTVLLLSLLVILPSCKEEHEGAQYSAYATAMDTNAVITVYGEGAEKQAKECVKKLYALESELSVTAEGSSIYLLNSGEAVPAEGDFYTLCGFAKEVCDLTDGAYNPCIYPLVKLWGFTTGNYNVPTDGELDKTLSLVTDSELVFADGMVKMAGGGQADLGGIAKGYAADVLKSYLSGCEADGAIISLGGNIVTLGTKPDGTPWNIGVNSPKNDGSLLGTLSVGECAVVTSGSYLRNFEYDGKVYHHIIDPKTGKPVDNGIVSVTVVADDSTLADGLSTAFFVLGMERSFEIAQSVGVETIFVTVDKIYVSDGLAKKFTPDASVEGVYEIVYS